MRREAAVTEKAVKLIGKPNKKTGRPHTAYSAALHVGINLRTIYRALGRRKLDLAGKTP